MGLCVSHSNISSDYLLWCCHILSDSSIIAVLIRNIGQLTCKRRGNCYSSFMQLLMVILFVAIVISTCFVYINFITSGIKTNHVVAFIVTFLPSAILTIILGWFVTKSKFIEHVVPKECDTTRKRPQLDLPTEQTPLTLTSV